MPDNGKVLVPVESTSQIKARLKTGTLKRIMFDALESAGTAGLSTAELADIVQVKTELIFAALRRLPNCRLQCHSRRDILYLSLKDQT